MARDWFYVHPDVEHGEVDLDAPALLPIRDDEDGGGERRGGGPCTQGDGGRHVLRRRHLHRRRRLLRLQLYHGDGAATSHVRAEGKAIGEKRKLGKLCMVESIYGQRMLSLFANV